MTVWTTPRLRFSIDAIDLTTCRKLVVSFVQGKTELTVDDPTVVDEHTLEVQLTQEQSGQFRAFGVTNDGKIAVKVNLITDSGRRLSTHFKYLNVEDNYPKEVI